MTVARPTAFWITIAVIVLVMLVLLREILPPFAIGMALAYLLVPAVDRLEQVGINRGLAALILILVLAVGFVGLLLVLLPALVGELRFFLDEFPRYVTRVQSLAADTGRPWLHRIMGQELRIEESVTHTVAAMGSAWLDDLVRSAWSGGKALLSLLSLLVVVPIVSIYLLTDWDRMIATIDDWVPAKHRDDVRAVARADRDLPDPGCVLRHRTAADGSQPCHPDRSHRRPDQLCPLSGARRRLRRGSMRGDRPVLA
jgi:predicted PurR-regulated permease PerM